MLNNEHKLNQVNDELHEIPYWAAQALGRKVKELVV